VGSRVVEHVGAVTGLPSRKDLAGLLPPWLRED
jgi:fructokinase